MGSCINASFMAFLAFLLGCGVFCNPVALRGGFVYDDKGTVYMNPTVTGELNISSIWTRDLWGEINLTSNFSHKSWRPLATLTMRWNYQYSGKETVPYHVVNVVLHGLTAAAAVPTCLYMEADLPIAFAAAMLFAAHPVHVESVACITGRSDVMCGFFFLWGFVLYAWCRGPCWRNPKLFRSIVMLLIVIIFTIASLLSKELGIMLPIWCVCWDIFQSQITLMDLLRFRKHARIHILRHMFSFAFTFALAYWRLEQNGGSAPDLGERQSPVAVLPTFQERFLSNAWQHMRHAAFLCGLTPLCPDWSDGSVAFVRSFFEWRAILSFAIYASLVPVFWRLFRAEHRCAPVDQGLAFAILNFMLAANVIIRVGFVLAERILYLPSLGTCLAIACGLAGFARTQPKIFGKHGTGVTMAVVAVYSRHCWVHAEAYGGAERLWQAARINNPHSGLVIYELGMTLHNLQKYQESVDLMREGFEQHPEIFDSDLLAHFILAESERVIGDCQSARETAQKGLRAIIRRTDGKIHKGEAYLHITLSRCALSLQEAGREAYEAVAIAHRQGDKPAYDYALEHATVLKHNLEKAGYNVG